MKKGDQNSLSLWLFVFGVCFASFHILPAFLNFEIKHKFMAADFLDIFTPYIIIFLVYTLYKISKKTISNNKTGHIKTILILGAITFVEGHGIHLAANAIHRHLDPDSSSIYLLIYFFDETLGHILWDGGVIVLTIGMILIGVKVPEKIRKQDHIVLNLIGAVFFGFTYFVNAVEGQTVVFTFPSTILFIIFLLLEFKRKELSFTCNSILIFFLIGYLISFKLFLIWFIWQGGFPQFSELGWI